MKRKAKKKIELHKETLRELANPPLADVAGGLTLSCHTCHTVACTVCHTC